MSRPIGSKTVKIILGEVLFEVFSKDTDKILSISDIKELVRKFEIKTTNLGEIIRREYTEVISFEDGNYTLNPDWKIEGFLGAVNDHRRKADLPPLGLDQPNLKER